MPTVALFDGENRRIFLDASIADDSWLPIDIYREYRVWRAMPGNRKWFPLIEMLGGEPLGGGTFVPRILRMRTDEQGFTTKLVPPDVGPYRSRIAGSIGTDNADVDPEPFDLSGLTTAVTLDYQPPLSELIEVGGGAGADDVWGAPIQGHQQDGSTGEALEQARVAALNAAALSA